MKNERMRKIIAIFYSFIFFLVCSVESTFAANQIIDDVEIVTNPAGWEVHVFFNAFFQMSGYNPKEKGDYLQIELRAARISGLDITDLLTEENIVWAPSKDVPLIEVTYSGESSFSIEDFKESTNRLGIGDIRSQIKLRFLKPLQYKVHASADLRSVVIFIPNTEAAASLPEKKSDKVIDLFAVNLMSSPQQVDQNSLNDHPLFKEHTLYQAKAKLDGQIWYRWRLGFFDSKETAEQKLHELKKVYPQAWVVEVSKAERLKQMPEEKRQVASKDFVKRKVRPLKPERLAALLEEAKKEMTAGNNNRAIQLYSRILLHPDPIQQQKALELLGLARERKGQMAHAKALYEEYLAKYPESDGAQRVQQRLKGMLTARSQPKGELRKARQVLPDQQWEKEFFGSIAQDYQYDESTTEGRRFENVNSLTSDADINFRMRNEQYDLEAVFVGSNENDFSDDKDDEARISALSLDFLAKDRGFYARFGRQNVNTGGVLGRFDGLLTNYQVSPDVKMNLVFGYPVESTKITKVEKEKYFYGINFDLGTFAEQWDYNLFLIEQKTDGMIDRRAIGGEVKYYTPQLSVFSLVDYDIFYQKLNTLLVVGDWKATDSLNVNTQIDYKLTPLLTTTNALQGQSVDSIDELKLTYGEDEIEQLAEDRSAELYSLLLGITYDLNETWQLYSDATVMNTKGTAASGGVEAYSETGEEYLFNAQFIGVSLLKEGDLAIVGARYSDLSSYNRTSFFLRGRYPVTREFRVSPKITFEYREKDAENHERVRWTPSVQFDYRLRKNIRLELEAGSEFTREDDNSSIATTDRYWVIFRYRFIF